MQEILKIQQRKLEWVFVALNLYKFRTADCHSSMRCCIFFNFTEFMAWNVWIYEYFQNLYPIEILSTFLRRSEYVFQFFLRLKQGQAENNVDVCCDAFSKV